jgi:uroporphyrin-III C-methyltransferase/precorrin-2 dehydrogenase/sirohydrochlorin ferrochelatase
VDDVKIAVNAGGDPRRAMALRDAVATALETGDLPLRRHRKAEEAAPSGPATGVVALVGGGPGDTGLITVRGRRLLGQADVVVADRLGPRELLGELAPDVRVIEVGKTPGHHPVPQSEINRVLVAEAQRGNRVVRLKGGDPYVLGRGGEEAEYCRQHGVEVEVVPGVTSAISVPAAAGIPVTHRGLAKGFSVVTGHEELSEVPARADHTVVLLMGVGQLRDSAASLARAGLPAGTPVGIVENGYLPNQRVTIGTLGTIAAQADAVGVANPAVIVIGDVVRVSPFAPSHFKTADYSTITPNSPRVLTP